jgi:elongation factor G
MGEIEPDRLRNVGLLGHGGSGKTSIGEAMLFSSETTKRLGKVEDGSSVFDHEPEEIKRQLSISTAFHSLSWKRFQCSLIDTPGYSAFFADTVHSMRAFGGAVFVLNPSLGLRVESERLWTHANENNICRLLFVNKMDRETSDYAKSLEMILDGLQAKGVHLQVPIRSGDAFTGVVDLLLMKAFVFEGNNGKFAESGIPEELREFSEEMRVRLVESVAEMDDALIEKYLDGQELSLEEIKQGIRIGTLQQRLFPILYGSAAQLGGIPQLLDAIVDYLPSPSEEGELEGKNPVTGETEKRAQDPSGPFSAFVFKTLIDPFTGRLSIMRVVSGKITPDMTVYNSNKDGKEKIGHLFRLEGKKQESVDAAIAGEIVAAAKLKDVSSGDTLCDERAPVRFDGLVKFPSHISFALEPKSRADEDKVPQGLQRMIEEDSSIEMYRDQQTREFILSGTGQLHIEVIVEKLKRKYGAEVDLKAPKVPYKETIKGRASAQGKYKKQSGGRGQYGDTWITLEPLPSGGGFEFVDKIVGGAIPRNYIPAVEKGVKETMGNGYLAGYPMVDVRATLYDGSFHAVDSSDMAFKIAGSMGFKNAVEKAKPVILEPIMSMEVTAPDDCVGDVIGDLNSRRGRVLGVEAKGHYQVIKTKVPMAEILRYAPDLTSLTSGRGDFQVEFSHYEELPAHLSEKVIKETKAAVEAQQKD